MVARADAPQFINPEMDLTSFPDPILASTSLRGLFFEVTFGRELPHFTQKLLNDGELSPGSLDNNPLFTAFRDGDRLFWYLSRSKEPNLTSEHKVSSPYLLTSNLDTAVHCITVTDRDHFYSPDQGPKTDLAFIAGRDGTRVYKYPKFLQYGEPNKRYKNRFATLTTWDSSGMDQWFDPDVRPLLSFWKMTDNELNYSLQAELRSNITFLELLRRFNFLRKDQRSL